MVGGSGRHRRVNFAVSCAAASLAAMSCLTACGSSTAARIPVLLNAAFTAPPAPQDTVSFTCTSSTECVALTVMSNRALATLAEQVSGGRQRLYRGGKCLDRGSGGTGER